MSEPDTSDVYRIRVFSMVGSAGDWGNLGTGFFVLGDDSLSTLSIIDEDDLKTKVFEVPLNSRAYEFRKQKEKIICIRSVSDDAEVNRGLSFSSVIGCNIVWKRIEECTHQHLKNTENANQDLNSQPYEHFASSYSSKKPSSDSSPTLEIPLPTIDNLPHILTLMEEVLYSSYTPTFIALKTELIRICTSPLWLSSFTLAFDTAEATNNSDILVCCFALIRRLISTNHSIVFEKLLIPPFVKTTFGCLEYDPSLAPNQRVRHREFIFDDRRMKKLTHLPLSGQVEMEAIFNFHLLYFKDVAACCFLDDMAFNSINNIIQANVTNLIMYLITPIKGEGDNSKCPLVCIVENMELDYSYFQYILSLLSTLRLQLPRIKLLFIQELFQNSIIQKIKRALFFDDYVTISYIKKLLASASILLPGTVPAERVEAFNKYRTLALTSQTKGDDDDGSTSNVTNEERVSEKLKEKAPGKRQRDAECPRAVASSVSCYLQMPTSVCLEILSCFLVCPLLLRNAFVKDILSGESGWNLIDEDSYLSLRSPSLSPSLPSLNFSLSLSSPVSISRDKKPPLPPPSLSDPLPKHISLLVSLSQEYLSLLTSPSLSSLPPTCLSPSFLTNAIRFSRDAWHSSAAKSLIGALIKIMQSANDIGVQSLSYDIIKAFCLSLPTETVDRDDFLMAFYNHGVIDLLVSWLYLPYPGEYEISCLSAALRSQLLISGEGGERGERGEKGEREVIEVFKRLLHNKKTTKKKKITNQNTEALAQLFQNYMDEDPSDEDKETEGDYETPETKNINEDYNPTLLNKKLKDMVEDEEVDVELFLNYLWIEEVSISPECRWYSLQLTCELLSSLLLPHNAKLKFYFAKVKFAERLSQFLPSLPSFYLAARTSFPAKESTPTPQSVITPSLTPLKTYSASPGHAFSLFPFENAQKATLEELFMKDMLDEDFKPPLPSLISSPSPSLSLSLTPSTSAIERKCVTPNFVLISIIKLLKSMIETNDDYYIKFLTSHNFIQGICSVLLYEYEKMAEMVKEKKKKQEREGYIGENVGKENEDEEEKEGDLGERKGLSLLISCCLSFIHYLMNHYSGGKNSFIRKMLDYVFDDFLGNLNDSFLTSYPHFEPLYHQLNHLHNVFLFQTSSILRAGVMTPVLNEEDMRNLPSPILSLPMSPGVEIGGGSFMLTASQNEHLSPRQSRGAKTTKEIDDEDDMFMLIDEKDLPQPRKGQEKQKEERQENEEHTSVHKNSTDERQRLFEQERKRFIQEKEKKKTADDNDLFASVFSKNKMQKKDEAESKSKWTVKLTKGAKTSSGSESGERVSKESSKDSESLVHEKSHHSSPLSPPSSHLPVVSPSSHVLRANSTPEKKGNATGLMSLAINLINTRKVPPGGSIRPKSDIAGVKRGREDYLTRSILQRGARRRQEKEEGEEDDDEEEEEEESEEESEGGISDEENQQRQRKIVQHWLDKNDSSSDSNNSSLNSSGSSMSDSSVDSSVDSSHN